MRKKKVLIICQFFEPLNAVGAIRPSKLAKYLTDDGFDVDVITSAKCYDKSVTNKKYKVLYAGNIKKDVQQTNNDTNHHNRRIISRIKVDEIKKTYRQLLVEIDAHSFFNEVKRMIHENYVKIEKYECVFTTYGPMGSLMTGRYLKRKYPNIVWINDFRDPIVSVMMPKILLPYYRYVQNKSVREADYVTTVSNGYMRRISKGKYQNKVFVIPNGYDESDRPLTTSCPNDDAFSFAYVGSLYNGARDLSLLFEVLSELVADKLLNMKMIHFHYAGDDYEVLLAQAEKYNMGDCIINHGRISRNDCLSLQSSVRYLVLSTWNEKGEEGVFPGKLIEYMLFRKPIISIVNGSLSNAEVTETIQNLQLGISCEDSDSSRKERMHEWLLEQVQCVKNGNPTRFSPDNEMIEKKYNWVNIVRRFEEIINGDV